MLRSTPLLLPYATLPRNRLYIRPGLGVGDNWREPSFFVVGPDLTEIDQLAQQFRAERLCPWPGRRPRAAAPDQ